MGLECSLDEAYDVWRMHIGTFVHGGYESYGLPSELIEFMNRTMSMLLPEEMLVRYDLPIARR